MAYDILEELFYGRFSPWENIPKDNPAIGELIHQQSEIRIALEKSLADADRKLSSQYMESRDDLDQKLYCHYFKISFLLGAFSPNGCILECFYGLLHSDRNTPHIKRILVYIMPHI